MEVWMPRQFGLKATSAAARSASVGSSSATPDPSASAPASKSRSPGSSQASKLASQCAELPFSPASWRGCHGRRSISQDWRSRYRGMRSFWSTHNPRLC